MPTGKLLASEVYETPGLPVEPDNILTEYFKTRLTITTDKLFMLYECCICEVRNKYLVTYIVFMELF